MVVFAFSFAAQAEDGYRLWLRYDKIDDAALLQQYRSQISSVYFENTSPTLDVVKKELLNGLQGLLDKKIGEARAVSNSIVVLLNPKKGDRKIITNDETLGKEGFAVLTFDKSKKIIVITANTDVGCLYGVFHFLRLLQTHQSIENLNIISVPKSKTVSSIIGTI